MTRKVLAKGTLITNWTFKSTKIIRIVSKSTTMAKSCGIIKENNIHYITSLHDYKKENDTSKYNQHVPGQFNVAYRRWQRPGQSTITSRKQAVNKSIAQKYARNWEVLTATETFIFDQTTNEKQTLQFFEIFRMGRLGIATRTLIGIPPNWLPNIYSMLSTSTSVKHYNLTHQQNYAFSRLGWAERYPFWKDLFKGMFYTI